MGAAIPLASAGAGLLGSGKAAKAQSNAANAQQQLTQQQLGIEQQQLNDSEKFINNFFGGVLPQIQSLLSGGLSGQGPLGELLNFGAQQQPELNDLSNRLARSGQSTIETLMSRLGGATPNPNALAEDLFTKNFQNNQDTTLGMQSQLTGQNLSALSSGLSGIENLLGLESGPVGGAMNARAGVAGNIGDLASQYGKTAASFGNPWASGISSAANTLSGIDWGGNRSATGGGAGLTIDQSVIPPINTSPPQWYPS